MYTIHPTPALESNYIWTIEHNETKDTLVVDPGEADGIIAYLEKNSLNLTALLITHSHWDHVTGIKPLMDYYKSKQAGNDKDKATLPIYGPGSIEHVNNALEEGREFHFHDLTFETLHTPGHLPEHLSYVAKIDGHPSLFCGDTLFSAGCGRIFSGTPEQLHQSLQRLAQLPVETKVYCAHEYTEANLNFAHAVDPDNSFIEEYRQEVKRVRATGKPSLPSLIGIERKINPFLRVNEPAIIQSALSWDNSQSASQNNLTEDNQPTKVFQTIRAWKDQF